jgi:hypothetical protein
MDQLTVDIADAPAGHRFEARLHDGTLVGLAAYDIVGAVMVFTHIDVDPVYEGRGIADQLARTALDCVRAREVRLVALCPSVRMFLHRHPEYADLVEPPQAHLERLPHPRIGDEGW